MLAGLAAAIAAPAAALTGEVSPGVFFGSGNANGSFTIGTGGGVEVGLRGKLRFDENNQPQNIFNWDGNHTYTFRNGTPPSGFGFALNAPTTPVWNFEFSINVGSGNNLGDYFYELSLGNPDSTNALVFDPINDGVFDHAIFDTTRTTDCGSGTASPCVRDSAADYANLIASNPVAQQSWSYEFFNDAGPLASFDPDTLGTYAIALSVFERVLGENGAEDSRGTLVASSEIKINVVPVPATLPLLAGAVGAFAFLRRRARATGRLPG
jgi:hypothetical protein